MSLSIALAVNGGWIDSILIVNRGPVDGRYAEGDHESGDGVRRYEWRSTVGSHHGYVEHARGDGAHVLASKVLAAVAQAASLDGAA